jgi:hypothetical protein
MLDLHRLTYKLEYKAMSTSGLHTWIHSRRLCEQGTRKDFHITIYFCVAFLNNV